MFGGDDADRENFFEAARTQAQRDFEKDKKNAQVGSGWVVVALRGGVAWPCGAAGHQRTHARPRARTHALDQIMRARPCTRGREVLATITRCGAGRWV